MSERLPDFLVLGAQKAGSTWFTRNLRSHPEIYMPLEEVRFFTKNYELGAAWYSDHFASAQTDQRVGEGTPGYLYVESAAQRILGTLGPDVKLIASLRNPVDRAYSSFWNLIGGGLLPVDAVFEEEFDKDTNGLRTRGLYNSQVRRFLDTFGEDRLFISVLELDLGEHAPTTLSRVYDFLDVNPNVVPETATKRANVGGSARRGGAGVARIGAAISRASDHIPKPIERAMRTTYGELFKRLPESRTYEPLDDAQLDACREYYCSDVGRLSGLIGRDLSLWMAERT